MKIATNLKDDRNVILLYSGIFTAKKEAKIICKVTVEEAFKENNLLIIKEVDFEVKQHGEDVEHLNILKVGVIVLIYTIRVNCCDFNRFDKKRSIL